MAAAPRGAAQPPFTLAQGCVAFLTTAVVLLLLGGFADGTRLAHGALVSPDSYMRLVRLRDELAAHAPLQAVMRDGSGAETVLEWSHWLDSVLVLLAAPLVPLLGQDEALRWAGIMLGPLSAGCLGIAVAWAGAPLAEPGWRWTAALTAAFAPPILFYALPGVVHHHVLIALAATMCAGWAGRAVTHGAEAGWNLGAWTGLGIWISPEVAPVALLASSAVGLAWVLSPDAANPRRAMLSVGPALLLTVGLAVAVDPPAGGYLATDIDRVSLAYIWLAALCCVVGLVLTTAGIRLHSVGTRLAAAAIVTAIAAGAWLAMFPTAFGGAEGVLQGGDPSFFAGIAEMLPIDNARLAVNFLTAGLVGLGAATLFAILRRSIVWIHVALCVALLLAASVAHRRFSTYPACAGVIAVPILLTAITAGLARRPPILGMLARTGLVLAFLFVPFLPILRPAAGTTPSASACDLIAAAPMLAPLAGQIVLTNIDDTPEVLYRSDVLTVGSLYHRNLAGFDRLRDAWRAVPGDKVPAAVRQTGASFVLFCGNRARPTAFLGGSHETLWDALAEDRPPPWLRPSGDQPHGGYVLYRISPPSG